MKPLLHGWVCSALALALSPAWAQAQEHPDRVVQPGVPQGKVTAGKFADSKVYPGTTRDFSVYVPAQDKPDEPAALMVFMDGGGYPAAAKPVFVGHYWLSAPRPTVLADNVACLDFSVAKGGFLCGYRWDGEQTLSNDNFVWAKGDGP